MSYLSRMDQSTGYDDFDPRDEYEPEPEKPASVQAGACPVCGDMTEENEHGFCPPITLKLCSCGDYCCGRCIGHCSDPECSNTECADCITTCEGHAEKWCREHIVAKTYCKDCAPPAIRREEGMAEYAESMRD